MQLKAVVLPAPLGPMRPTISKSLTSSVTSCSACSPPNRMDRSRTSSTDTGALHSARTGVSRVVVQGERVARQPTCQRPQLRAQPTRVEDQRLQQQQRPDHAGDRALAGAVVALEDRHVLQVDGNRLGEEELVEQVVEDAEER